MFDIGWSEMAVVALVALIVIGPKDLPRVARNVGQWVAKGRAMAREFQRALEDMAREAELDKVKSEIEKAGRTNLGNTIEKTIDPSGELSKAFDPVAPAGKRADGAQPAGAPATQTTASGAPAAPAQPASSVATGAPTQPATVAVAPGGAGSRRRAALAMARAPLPRAREPDARPPARRLRRALRSPPNSPTPARNGDGHRQEAQGSPTRPTAPAEPN